MPPSERPPYERGRANTTFSSFWKKQQKPDDLPTPPAPSSVPLAPPPPPAPSLQLDDLIAALSPPATPTLDHARALAELLETYSPPPAPASLIPLLRSLCAPTSPPAIRCAGFDIMRSLLSVSGAHLSVIERKAFWSVLSLAGPTWAIETWESRTKAVIELTQSGQETVGLDELVRELATWAESAFVGLLQGMSDRAERERCLEVSGRFITHLFKENARVFSEKDVIDLHTTFSSWLDRTLELESKQSNGSRAFSPNSSNTAHRRHPSSVSVPSSPPLAPRQFVQPLYTVPGHVYMLFLAVNLSATPTTFPSSLLPHILTSLTTLLSFSISPLPKLSLPTSNVQVDSRDKSTLEKRTTDLLLQFLSSAAYSTYCLRTLKQLMLASNNPKTAYGSARALRLALRQAAEARIARAYLAREVASHMSPSGAPVLTGGASETELYERAWSREPEGGAFELIRLGGALREVTKGWINREAKDGVLSEVIGIVKDVLDEAKSIDEPLREEDGRVVGEVIRELAEIVKQTRSADGSPHILQLQRPVSSPSPLLADIASLLALPLSTAMTPSLSSTLLSLSNHLSDISSASLVEFCFSNAYISPTAPDWHDTLAALFDKLYLADRPRTRRELTWGVRHFYFTVHELPSHRIPLVELVLTVWEKSMALETDEDVIKNAWEVLAEEVVLCAAGDSDDHEGSTFGHRIRNMWCTVARESPPWDEELDFFPSLTSPPPLPTPSSSSSGIPSSSAIPSPRDHSTPIPLVMNLLNTLTSGTQPSTPVRESPADTGSAATSRPPVLSPLSTSPIKVTKAVSTVLAIIKAFSSLMFAPHSTKTGPPRYVIALFKDLLSLLSPGTGARCPKARLVLLQWLVRLRADRDHRLYVIANLDNEVRNIASLIGRVSDRNADPFDFQAGLGRDRSSTKGSSEVPTPRDGRQMSRDHDTPNPSRSRSRPPPPRTPSKRSREPLWNIPETLLFDLPHARPSHSMATYERNAPPTADDEQPRFWLPVSFYVGVIVEIINMEKDWELLSYTLCHLPRQLANKHFFCGPKTREATVRLLNALCQAIHSEELAARVDLPHGLRLIDAQGLGYHSLSVLISYRRLFTRKQQDLLIEVFIRGLKRHKATTKPCIQALTIAAYELQASMTRWLTLVLQSLSQTMTNPAMVVHILEFLVIVASIPTLYSNFTEEDYRRVFAVALQYIQHHNQPDFECLQTADGGESYALAQHVLGVAYYIIYVWFMAIKLSDRPKYVPFITRGLLIANESKERVDEPSEVCFDWLARYTYGSADPKPAPSFLSEMVMKADGGDVAISEKTWVLGNSIVTMRTLRKNGWLEIISHRASGTTKFLCRLENFPLIGLGDINPDMASLPATLMASRDPDRLNHPAFHAPTVPSEASPTRSQQISSDTNETAEPGDDPRAVFTLADDLIAAAEEDRPDPISGFVWSGPAPSQRRKDVELDPSFMALQLSAYPAVQRPSSRSRIVPDDEASKDLLAKTLQGLGRAPVIDCRKIAVMYVAPGQTTEREILGNRHGSPAYTRFLAGLGRLVKLGTDLEVYTGGLSTEDGEYAYAWWDDIGQIFYHTATLMPNRPGDTDFVYKKLHIGNDFVRIVWNDSGLPYRFDTLATQFQFVNIVIEPHSAGTIAAYSDDIHEHETFKVMVQLAPGMPDMTPIGDFKLLSVEHLPDAVRQISLLADFFTSVYVHTDMDTNRTEFVTNWRNRLQQIKRFRDRLPPVASAETSATNKILAQETARDFTNAF